MHGMTTYWLAPPGTVEVKRIVIITIRFGRDNANSCWNRHSESVFFFPRVLLCTGTSPVVPTAYYRQIAPTATVEAIIGRQRWWPAAEAGSDSSRNSGSSSNSLPNPGRKAHDADVAAAAVATIVRALAANPIAFQPMLPLPPAAAADPTYLQWRQPQASWRVTNSEQKRSSAVGGAGKQLMLPTHSRRHVSTYATAAIGIRLQPAQGSHHHLSATINRLITNPPLLLLVTTSPSRFSGSSLESNPDSLL